MTTTDTITSPTLTVPAPKDLTDAQLEAFFYSPVASKVERIIKLALHGSGVSFRRALKYRGARCETDEQLEAIGGPYLATFSDQWQALTGDAGEDQPRAGFFYWDDEWRHPDTGEDLAQYLHRVLWDRKHEAGRLNSETVRLSAYVKRPGSSVTLERSP